MQSKFVQSHLLQLFESSLESEWHVSAYDACVIVAPCADSLLYASVSAQAQS